MKKIVKSLIAAAVLICGFAFTGCMQQMVQNTQGKWYKYNKTVDIPLGFSKSGGETEETLKGASLYVYYESGKGLKVAIQAESTESVEVLGGLLSQDITITAGAVYEFGPNEFGDTKWTALIALSAMQQCDEPKISSNPDECLEIGGVNAKETKIQWKKVLANIIIGKLLGE